MSPPERARPKGPKRTPPPLPAAAPRPQRPMFLWAFVGVGIVLLAAVALTILYFSLVENDQASIPSSDSDDDFSNRTRRRRSASNPVDAPTEARQTERVGVRNGNDPAVVPADQSARISSPGIVPTANSAPRPATKPASAWEQALWSLGSSLPLPKREQTLEVFNAAEPAMIAPLPATDPRTVDLLLYAAAGSSWEIGQANSSKQGFVLRVEDKTAADGKLSRRWTVERKIIDQFTQMPKFTEVGRFELADEKLTFQWDMDAPAYARSNSLQYCLLQISRENQSRMFQLSAPTEAQDVALDLLRSDQEIPLAIKSDAVEDPETLHLDLKLMGVDSAEHSRTGLTVGKSATFTSKHPITAGDGRVELVLSFGYDETKGPSLTLNTLTRRTVMIVPNNPREVPEELTNFARYRESAQAVPIMELRMRTGTGDFDRIARNAGLAQKSLQSARLFKSAQQESQKQQQKLQLLELELQRIKGMAINPNANNPNPMNPQAMTSETKIQSQITAAQQLQARAASIIQQYQERIDLAATQIAWSQEMRRVFQRIAETGRVGYSVYIMIDGQKVYLARSESYLPPKAAALRN